MSDETNVDPILTNDLSDVSPDQPLVNIGEYTGVVKKVEQKKSQSSDNLMLNIQIQTLDSVTTVAGEVVPPGGMTFFGRIMLTPTEKRSKEAIQRDLKRFQLACGVTSGSFHPFSQYEGKNIKFKIGFAKKTPDYPDDRNEIKQFVIP